MLLLLLSSRPKRATLAASLPDVLQLEVSFTGFWAASSVVKMHVCSLQNIIL
jgi:hypothetical protein